jgi:hypothetical protein
MPSLATTVEVSTTREIKLSPKLRKTLLTAMRTYGALKAQRDALDAQMKTERISVEEALAELGEEGITLEGHKATLVAPVRRKLDEKKLIKAGVARDLIDKCYSESASTPYVKITLLGAKDDE